MTKLTQDQERHLQRIADAANRLDGAKEAIRAAALDAIGAGVPQTRIAEAGGMGRMQLWRWLKAEREQDQSTTRRRDANEKGDGHAD